MKKKVVHYKGFITVLTYVTRVHYWDLVSMNIDFICIPTPDPYIKKRITLRVVMSEWGIKSTYTFKISTYILRTNSSVITFFGLGKKKVQSINLTRLDLT